jgi:transposase-like protein
MRDDTRRGIRGARGGEDRQELLVELGVPLEELVRRGACDILQRAIEAELEQLLDEFAAVSLIDGRGAVVRNGYLPAREILTTVGPVEVQVPKVRDRSGSGVKFNSALAPPYVRRSARVAAALPWLYLKGISSGDLGEALEVLVGEGAKGLSPAALGRLKAQWSEEYKGWAGRSLAGKEYAYWWVDGIYTTLRESDDPKLCLLVIIGVTAAGTKEWVAISDGLRESTESWLDVLRDLKERGLEVGAPLAVGDGALGFWKALDQLYPETVHQRCWFHKLGNVLTDLPRSLHSRAKAALQAIWMAPRRARRPPTPSSAFSSATGPSTPRPPRSWRRTARPCWPSSTSRPSTGCTCAPPTPSSRPSPRCAIAPAAPRTA